MSPLDTDVLFNNLLLLYPNTSPYLLVTHPSLEKLNSRLNEKILRNRFRAHIIVTGDDNSQLHPYEEVMAVTFILAM